MSFSKFDRVRLIAAELAKKLAAIDKQIHSSPDSEANYRVLAAAMDDCLAALVELNTWGPENRLPSSEIWTIAGDQLARGWLQNHARAKPRGYAGDHEMLARVYENWCCSDPLGQLFDRYFQAQAAPQAVRNRMRMMTGWISAALQERESTRVAVVGSAFGLEVRDALLAVPATSRHSACLTLLDLDPAALEFARERLEPVLLPEHLILHSANLFRLPDRAVLAAKLTGSDLLFCPGLFDYLDDAAAVAMIRCLFAQLAPGGQLIIFQFAPHNPTRAYMEWLGNWHLTYRDPEGFQGLFDAAALEDASIEFSVEPLGIDLYAKATRNN